MKRKRDSRHRKRRPTLKPAALQSITGIMAAHQLRIGASCTIQNVAAIRAQLLEALGQSAPVHIDASEVARIDSAGIQLFVAFALDCMEKNQAFAWSGRSVDFEAAVDMLGVRALLESPGISALPSGAAP